MKHLTIGIIGGTGRMGQWLVSFFEDAGYQTLIASRHTSLKPIDLSQKSDVVVLSVPINMVEKVIAEIGPHIKEDSLLMDVASLKTRVMELMLKHTKSSVIGTHPLFGPNTRSIKNHAVVLCPGRGDKWFAWLSNLFKEKGVKIKITTPEEHDRMMSIIQGLTHLSTIAMAYTMKALNVNIDESMEYATPIYRLKLNIMGRLFAQNLILYRDIEVLNPYARKIATTFLHSVKEIVKMVEEGDMNKFAESLKAIGDFVGDFRPIGLKETNKLFGEMLDKKLPSEIL